LPARIAFEMNALLRLDEAGDCLVTALARSSIISGAIIVLATVVTLYPLLGHGFLIVGFDDDAFILDNPFTHALTWSNAWACLTHCYMYDYLPLPMLSYLGEYPLWGATPAGYHLTNLLLHIVASLLVCALTTRLVGRRAGLFAGLIFALHPVQVGAVSIIAQRKTVLATAFVTASLLAYHRFRDGRRGAYWLALFFYVCACGSKSSVVTFPLLLLAYDYWFRERVALADKLPFFAVALATVGIGMGSKLGSEVVKGPHGGSYLTNWLAMSRVLWEYLDALLLPFNLSPTYYYSRAGVFGPLYWLSAAALPLAMAGVVRWRRRFPLTCFFLTWVFVSLLPVSNIVPIAVLRDDAYLYLPMVGFAIWAGAGCARAAENSRRWVRPLPYAALALLALLSRDYSGVWRNDVTAWTRVVERHPGNANAHVLLAVAYERAGALVPARELARRALQLDPSVARAQTLLAEIDERLGNVSVPEELQRSPPQ
jgi:protein O-mannosyl-transferase